MSVPADGWLLFPQPRWRMPLEPRQRLLGSVGLRMQFYRNPLSEVVRFFETFHPQIGPEQNMYTSFEAS